jgi:hypothetical protein
MVDDVCLSNLSPYPPRWVRDERKDQPGVDQRLLENYLQLQFIAGGQGSERLELGCARGYLQLYEALGPLQLGAHRPPRNHEPLRSEGEDRLRTRPAV